jgi:hypothetical protein
VGTPGIIWFEVGGNHSERSGYREAPLSTDGVSTLGLLEALGVAGPLLLLLPMTGVAAGVC